MGISALRKPQLLKESLDDSSNTLLSFLAEFNIFLHFPKRRIQRNAMGFQNVLWNRSKVVRRLGVANTFIIRSIKES